MMKEITLPQNWRFCLDIILPLFVIVLLTKLFYDWHIGGGAHFLNKSVASQKCYLEPLKRLRAGEKGKKLFFIVFPELHPLNQGLSIM